MSCQFIWAEDQGLQLFWDETVPGFGYLECELQQFLSSVIGHGLKDAWGPQNLNKERLRYHPFGILRVVDPW